MTKILNADDRYFKAYLERKRIMIVDPTASSRAGIARTLVSLGALTKKISLVSSRSMAIELAAEFDFDIVICEFNLKDGSGIDVFQSIRERKSESIKKLFLM